MPDTGLSFEPFNQEKHQQDLRNFTTNGLVDSLDEEKLQWTVERELYQAEKYKNNCMLFYRNTVLAAYGRFRQSSKEPTIAVLKAYKRKTDNAAAITSVLSVLAQRARTQEFAALIIRVQND